MNDHLHQHHYIPKLASRAVLRHQVYISFIAEGPKQLDDTSVLAHEHDLLLIQHVRKHLGARDLGFVDNFHGVVFVVGPSLSEVHFRVGACRGV